MCLSAALLPCAELLGVFAMVAVDHDTFEIHSCGDFCIVTAVYVSAVRICRPVLTTS